MPAADEMPADNAELAGIKVRFVRLHPDSPAQCPIPLPRLLQYLAGEVPGGDQLAGRDLKFVRSALVANRRYWVWRFTEPDGGMRAYATVSLDPDGTTTLGYGSDDYHLTAEQYILGDFHQVF